MFARRTVILGLFLLGIMTTILIGCGIQEKENTEVRTFTEADALALVLKEHPDFPEKPGVVNTIEVRTGGPAPGVIVKAELATETEKSSDNTYIITLTKEWKATINGIQPISYWKYNVQPDKVTLVESEDNDATISIIK